MTFEQYGLKSGTVFTIGTAADEYVICDLITHRWVNSAKRIEVLTDPFVVFRTVANINSWKPVHEQMQMLLSEYQTLCTVHPLISRILKK